MSIEGISAKLNQYLNEKTPQVLKVMQVELKKSIDMNFAAQGRPTQWRSKRRPDGRAVLTGRTGRLQRTINVVIDEANKRVTGGSNLIYGKIQQEGGTISMPARTLRFRKKNNKTVFASKKHKRIKKETQSTPYSITIPARPYLVVPESDHARILNNIKKLFK